MATPNTNMPVGENRPSLSINMENRFANERAGGAFDVKKDITTTEGSYNTVPFAYDTTVRGVSGNAGLEARIGKLGFKVGMKVGQTEFKEAQGATSLESSQYLNLGPLGRFSNRSYSNR